MFPSVIQSPVFGMAFGVSAVVVLTLAVGLSLAGEGGGCGMGMSGCDMAGMHHDHQTAAPTTQPGQVASATTQATTQPATVYTCPMHPEVQQDHPGNCPKCGMTLVPKQDGGHQH